jgi:hypothetical protein
MSASQAIVTSDRRRAYDQLPLACRQLCWAHVKRDVAAHAVEHDSASTASESAT